MCEIVVDAHANICTMYNDNSMLTCVLAVCKAKCNIARNTETQVCSWKIIGYNRIEMSDFKLDRKINLSILSFCLMTLLLELIFTNLFTHLHVLWN